MGRLSGGFDRCAHKSHGGPLPTSPLQPQVPGTQRGLPVPPGADTDIPLVGAGPGGPSKHATTPPIWGLPGALGASAPPQSTAARRPRVFYWGEARGLMPGGRGPQTPRRPSVIRLFSSAQPHMAPGPCQGLAKALPGPCQAPPPAIHRPHLGRGVSLSPPASPLAVLFEVPSKWDSRFCHG